jgi:anti-anti-sigma factor
VDAADPAAAVPPPDPDREDDLTIRQHGDVTVVRFNTDNLLGMRDAQFMHERLRRLILGPTRSRKLVIDFGGVRFAGSSTLGIVLGLHRTMQAEGGALVLATADALLPLLRLAKADRIVTLAPSVAAAIGVLNDPPSE